MQMILGPNETHYKPHHRNIKVLAEDGTLTGTVAWWSDDPERDGIIEAKNCVRLYKEHNVNVVRIVVDGNDNDKVIFRTDK